ncbi:MAG: radical SAM protein [Firmicutes bacterium]|nr:radical SAM protein [Bacillota bacterium]
MSDNGAGGNHKAKCETVRTTYSMCPVCLNKIPAELIRKDDQIIYMEKTCDEHGSFSVPVWKGFFDFDRWISREEPLDEKMSSLCDGRCSRCGDHPQDTCCVILEVTGDCNLRCPFCFALGGEREEMPSTAQIKKDIDRIVEIAGDPLLQLAGGEPTLRNDLPELAAYAKKAGCSYVQVNSNGIRLAEDEAYVKALAGAGVDIVFLQFDGTDDEIYRKLRGRDFVETKRKAIENCSRHGIGVTLVPTIIRGINDDRIGEIIREAVRLFPAVRSVHFQPVTYLGRYPDVPEAADRYTLDELMNDLVLQTGIPENALLPSMCDHAACEFHSTFIVDDERQLIPVSDRKNDRRKGRTCAADNRRYVAEHWKSSGEDCGPGSMRPPGVPGTAAGIKLVSDKDKKMDFDTFVRYMKTRTMKISAMAFQDAMNIDLERLSRCSLHVYEDGKIIPFCSKYMTPAKPSGR